MAIRNMVVRNQIGMTGGVIGWLMTHGLGSLSAGGLDLWLLSPFGLRSRHSGPATR